MKRALACLGLLACAALAAAQPAGPAASGAQDDYSAAERLLLMRNQMAGLQPGTVLHYRFVHSGSRDAAFEDDVRIRLEPRAGGGCCTAKGEFLSGARRLHEPDIDKPEGNPVILYFLERDIQDMKDATQGASAYFRKRIRMGLYQGAQVQPITVQYQGKPVAAEQIALTPYASDPNRARFPAYVPKRYVFTLSDSVPGGVVQIRTRVPGAGDTPLVEDVLTLHGASL